MGDAVDDLGSADIGERRAAVEAIQTLSDPRIPPACLPLLHDSGLSIRRQAARAIGSRFSEIPADQRGAYVKALKACASEGPEDVTLICQRGIGLLTQDYRAPSFSVGPHKKWVLYERHKLPVIAPAKGDGVHLLLSPYRMDQEGRPDLLKLEITNAPAAELFSPHWHPGGEAVAFTPVTQRRFYQPVCIWSAGEEKVTVLDPVTMKKLLPARYPAWGTTSEFIRWDGDKAIVRVYDCDTPDGTPPNDPGVLISYDLRSGEMAKVAK